MSPLNSPRYPKTHLRQPNPGTGLYSFPYPRLLLAYCLGAVFFIVAGCTTESRSNDPSRVVTRLVESLNDSNPDVRRTAALSLGKIGHPNSIPALITALGDRDPLVREYCAWALGQIESDLTEDAAIALIMALGDEAPGVKTSASLALGNVKPQKPLIKLLKEALAISENRTKIAVVQALSQFDTPSTYPIFLTALDDKTLMFVREQSRALGS